MEVILLDNIANLGKLGDKVNVKPGYARNYLIAQDKAVSATKKNINYFQERRAELEAKLASVLSEAQQRAAQIEALGQLTFYVKVRDGGKLFGSVSARDIADAVTEKGITLSKSEVRIANGALRELGDHSVVLRLHSCVLTEIRVVVAELS